MNPAQAREHIEMVERILAESSQRLCFGGEYFLVWGLFSAIATLGFGLINLGKLPDSAQWVVWLALAAAIAFSVLRGLRVKEYAQRLSLVQREFFNVLWLTVGLAFVANLAMFDLFPHVGQAAIWGFAESILLFYIGMHGNRRAQLGGIVLLACLIASNFLVSHVPATAVYVLAGGILFGYAGFGLAELLARD